MTMNFAELLQDILQGIRAELEAHPKHLHGQVRRRVIEGTCLKLFLQIEKNSGRCSGEELEGMVVEWDGLPSGGSTVLSASLEYGEEYILVEGKTSALPEIGKPVTIHLPQYLKTLSFRWENPAWGRTCLNWLEHFRQLRTANVFNPDLVPDSSGFPWLRQRQKEAFQLVGWKIGFLFGPPGTGKTTCSGAMVAQYLVQFPGSRVLLVSNTNQAVDQSLIAIDKHLEAIGKVNIATHDVRMQCVRFGSRYNRSYYRDRTHLLADVAQGPLRLPSGETIQPHPSGNRLEIARVVAMTVNRAIHTLNDLQEQGFSLMIVDEASQVGLAQAALLAPLASQVLFAGDPKQLSPIVKSTTRPAQTWLGNSAFSQIDESAEWVCFLDEQSRMAAPICRLISELFYSGKLTVADACLTDGRWQKERELKPVPSIGINPVSILATQGKCLWSAKYGGTVRFSSAESICDLSLHLARQVRESDILIVTPFRAQERLLREQLRKSGLNRVRVSTIHRAQGSEYHTVIFDPVDGKHRFLQTPEAKQLVNVAFSRARARLVLALSESDLGNPLVRQITTLS